MDASLKKKLTVGLILGFLIYVVFVFVVDLRRLSPPARPSPG